MGETGYRAGGLPLSQGCPLGSSSPRPPPPTKSHLEEKEPLAFLKFFGQMEQPWQDSRALSVTALSPSSS